MLITYFTFYLFFIVLASLLVSVLVLKLNAPNPKITIPAIIFFILSPLLIGYIYVFYFTSIPERTVPNLKGMTLEQAYQELESLELKGKFAGTIYDMKYPEGTVVSQQPESGRKVKIGRSVRLLTSSGKRRASVPNLLGRPLVQAEAVLAARGLMTGEITWDVVMELDPGIILSQSPAPGEEVDVDTYVTLTVSATAEAIKPIEENKSGDKKEDKGGFKLW